MLEGTKNYLFLIIDQENKGMLGYSYSASVSNAVSKGLSNTSVMLIPAFYFDKLILDKFNQNFRNNFKLVRKFDNPFSNGLPMTSEGNVCETVKDINVNKVFQLDPLDVSEDWLEKRKLAALRINKLKILETMLDRFITRFKNFTADSVFYSFLDKELSKCDPENNYYTDSIKEWADIYDISIQAAFQELQMNYDSASVTMFRINAIWQKYVDLVNSYTTKTELDSLEPAIEVEIKFGKRL